MKICLAVITLMLTFEYTALVFSQTTPSSFYFVQMTDTHFRMGNRMDTLKKAVSLLNDLPIPITFVAVTGDMTSENILDAEVMTNAMAQLRRIKAPVYYLPGNHDILSRNLETTLNYYQTYFGAPFQKIETNQVQLIFFYDEPLINTKVIVPGYKPLDWLQKQLEGDEPKPTIIFMHTPMVKDFYNNRFHDGWPEHLQMRFSELINKNGVVAVIAGHFHRDEFYWVGKVPLYVASSINDMWKRQPSFRVYEYNKGKVSYFTQYLE